MTTAERIVALLREKPLTRSELCAHIVEVTPRGLRYQLQYLQRYGFVKKVGRDNLPHYKLVKEDGFLTMCQCCRMLRPCWMVKATTCHYCMNVRGTGEAKPKAKKKAKPATKPANFAKEDACSIAFQPLLRGQRIGLLR